MRCIMSMVLTSKFFSQLCQIIFLEQIIINNYESSYNFLAPFSRLFFCCFYGSPNSPNRWAKKWQEIWEFVNLFSFLSTVKLIYFAILYEKCNKFWTLQNWKNKTPIKALSMTFFWLHYWQILWLQQMDYLLQSFHDLCTCHHPSHCMPQIFSFWQFSWKFCL